MSAAAGVKDRLGDDEPEVRRRAAQDIPLLPAPESCELLVMALGDEDWRVRKEAAAIASKVEPRTAVVFAVARALAERENIGLRNAAVEALTLIGPDAVPGAIDALDRLDPDGRKLAVEVLAGAPTLAGMRTLVTTASADADVNVVVAAAEALAKADLAGEEARDLAMARLTTLLENPHTQVRVAALDALRALGATIPWASLEPLLEDALLKRSAIAAAAGHLAPRALLAFAEAIAHPNASLAREATVSLGRSLEEAWGDSELLEVAAKTLRASGPARGRLRTIARAVEDPAARGAAILALALVRDPDDVPVIADALADDDVAGLAEEALRLYGQDAVEPLLVAGRTAAPTLRGATISMLPELGAPSPEPLAAAREALQESSPEVVTSGLKSLAIVGAAADLAPVARLTASPDPKVVSAAQAALLAIASREPTPARGLVQGVDPRGDKALPVAIILDALARVGAAEPADAEFLASALTHREASVRRAAIDSLATIGGEEAAEAVTISLGDEEAVVALAAIRALGRLGRAEQLAALAVTTKDPMRLGTVLRALKDADPVRAFAAARPLLRSREPSIAAAAIEAVGGVDLEGKVEALLSATDHADYAVVKLALGEIAKLGDERAFTALAAAIDHAEESVRKYAAELLGQVRNDPQMAHVGGAPEAETILRTRLDRERSADVRHAIMQALAARPAGTGATG